MVCLWRHVSYYIVLKISLSSAFYYIIFIIFLYSITKFPRVMQFEQCLFVLQNLDNWIMKRDEIHMYKCYTKRCSIWIVAKQDEQNEYLRNISHETGSAENALASLFLVFVLQNTNFNADCGTNSSELNEQCQRDFSIYVEDQQ